MTRIAFVAVALTLVGFAFYAALNVAPLVSHATSNAFGGF